MNTLYDNMIILLQHIIEFNGIWTRKQRRHSIKLTVSVCRFPIGQIRSADGKRAGHVIRDM